MRPPGQIQVQRAGRAARQGAGVAARPEHARPRDHSAAEPVARAVEGGVDAAPVLVVIPQGVHRRTAGAELLGAHADQPHGLGELECVEQADRDITDALADVGGLGEARRA